MIRRRRVVPALVCVALYCLLAVFGVYGVHSPVSDNVLPPCGCGDIASQVWFQEWPAYALSSGHNPFVSAFANYPGGVNLMDNTSAPLLGVVFAPVTWLFGPLASFNLVSRLALALSGIAMCFVLRRWTRWWPAAFAGGLLYAFSPLMVIQAGSHDYLTFSPLPPVILALLDEIVIRRRRPARNGIVLGVVLAAQLLISAEVLVITGLVAVFALVVLALRHPVGAMERAWTLLTGFAATAVTFVVLAGYPLWIFFRGPYYISGPPHPGLQIYHDEVLSLIYPTSLQRIGFGSWRGRGNLLAHGFGNPAYVGITLLCLFAVIVVRFWSDGRIQLFALVAVASWSITLGRFLYIGSTPHPSVRLPYDLLWHLPVIGDAADMRFSLIMFLALAVVLAVGIDRLHREGLLPNQGRHHAATTRGRSLRTASIAAAVGVALAPLVPTLPYGSTFTTTPSVFSAASSPIRRGQVVLSYPLSYNAPNSQALLWQAVSGMRFKLIEFPDFSAGPDHHGLSGIRSFLAPTEAEDVLAWGLAGKPAPPPPDDAATAAAIRAFLARYHVGAIAIIPAGLHWRAVTGYFTRALRASPERFGQALVWPEVQAKLAIETSRRP